MKNRELNEMEKILLIAGTSMTGKMLAWRKLAIISLLLNLLMVGSYWYDGH